MKVKAIKWFDRYILSVLVILLSFIIKGTPLRKQPNNILIIKLWAIGDSVVSLPLVKAIKEHYPKCNIDVLVTSRNSIVYEKCDYVDNVINIKDLKYKKYDLVFDLEPYLNFSAILARVLGKTTFGFSGSIRNMLYNHSTGHGGKNMVEVYLDMIRVFGWDKKVNKLVELKVNKEDKEWAETFIKYNKPKNLVGLAPAVAETAKNRMWPIENFIKLGNKLHEKGYDVMLIGSEEDKETLLHIRFMMKKNPFISYWHVNLPQLFYLVKKMKFVVSNDSGPMHIAAAQGTKTIGLFGPNTPTLWKPFGKNGTSIYKNFECSPCINNTTGKAKRCKYNGFCMKAISVKDVLKTMGIKND